MWLLDTTTLLLKHFSDDREAAKERYAILSHTWGREEVSFRDMTRGNVLDDIKRRKTKKKAGFAKVEMACEQAKKEGYHFIWIDTCCIDKESSAELSEAINSMYRWYADSAVCYVYLADFTMDEERRVEIARAKPDAEFLRLRFTTSRWFKRGWTLQELVAPEEVRFYDSQWTTIDSKARIAGVLSEVTGIDESVLRQPQLVKHFSVATRMSWAADRETTRVEDEAYSLLGLFDVSMPMVYGEGHKAFLRLQEEIIKVSTDHSIFAWSPYGADASRLLGTLLAPSTRCFAGARDIEAGADAVFGDSYEMSNSGLRIPLPAEDNGSYLIAQLNCQLAGAPVTLRLKRHSPQQSGSRNKNARRIICEVERGSAHEEQQSPRSPLEPEVVTDFVILRESFSCGISVQFDLSQGARITTANPSIERSEVYLSASTPGHFSHGYVMVQMDSPPLQERLYFGNFLHLRSAESTFRLYWARGYDPKSPHDVAPMQEDGLRDALPSKAHQSWGETVSGDLPRASHVRFDPKVRSPSGGKETLKIPELGPRRRPIDGNSLLARQHLHLKPARGEYRACFEATASLHLKQQPTRNISEPVNGVIDPATERVGLEAVFWKISIRAVVWNIAPDGECVYSVFDNLKDRLGTSDRQRPDTTAIDKRLAANKRPSSLAAALMLAKSSASEPL